MEFHTTLNSDGVRNPQVSCFCVPLAFRAPIPSGSLRASGALGKERFCENPQKPQENGPNEEQVKISQKTHCRGMSGSIERSLSVRR